MALIDDAGGRIVTIPANLAADWRRPFVASEIGEVLPHWEVAVYLRDPERFLRTANNLKRTLGVVIALLVIAIGLGSALIVLDIRRQMLVARQKTDFVSNVSHELKTPLTSIRMFSELLAEGRVTDEKKRKSYLQIISTESARLTRLINNVLSFSRLERGEQRFQKARLDLTEITRDVMDSYTPQLESGGFKVSCELPAQPLYVDGDRDGLAQVIVNLLANAEKYTADKRSIQVQVAQSGGMAAVRIKDRGPGVPAGLEKRIFEQFFRADDSLASGIQGSGLGLTLARQIARAHGGDVIYEPRPKGGSCFTLSVPLAKESA
jgi:signal transduction histidine kinase